MKRMEVLTLAVAVVAVCVEVRNRWKYRKERKALKLTPTRPASGA